MSQPQPHTNDIFHVIIDALVSHQTGMEGGEEPWLGYDEGLSPMGDPEGYARTLHDAKRFATADIGELAVNR